MSASAEASPSTEANNDDFLKFCEEIDSPDHILAKKLMSFINPSKPRTSAKKTTAKKSTK